MNFCCFFFILIVFEKFLFLICLPRLPLFLPQQKLCICLLKLLFVNFVLVLTSSLNVTNVQQKTLTYHLKTSLFYLLNKVIPIMINHKNHRTQPPPRSEAFPMLGLAFLLLFLGVSVTAFSAHSSHLGAGGGDPSIAYTSAFPSKLDLSTPLVSGVSVGRYNAKREYSPELARIYSRYLANDLTVGAMCGSHGMSPAGEPAAQSISEADISEAIAYASSQIQLYENANQQYLAIDPRGLNFSAYIFGALLQARFNEFITQYLTSK